MILYVLMAVFINIIMLFGFSKQYITLTEVKIHYFYSLLPILNFIAAISAVFYLAHGWFTNFFIPWFTDSFEELEFQKFMEELP